MIDTASGLAVRASPAEWHFPNVDLTVHLHRHPVDDRLGFDTSVVFGPDGLGITSSVVHDSTGPVGRLEQMVTIRRHSHPHRETGMRPDLPHREVVHQPGDPAHR